MHLLKNPLTLAHHLVAQCLKPGDTAVDATAGNGHDTGFLCQLVGPQGTVYAFDNQPLAIFRTAEKLKTETAGCRCFLINNGHENLRHYLDMPVQVIMFNLGYLPGSGKKYRTAPETTRAALLQAQELLLPGGLVTIVVYSGHEGAREEQIVVEEWCCALPQNRWTVVRFTFANWRNDPPYLLTVSRLPE